MATMDKHAHKVEAQLVTWGERIDALASHGADFGPNALAEYTQRMDVLRAKHTAVAARLLELRAAGPARWQSHKSGVDKACGELEVALAASSVKG